MWVALRTPHTLYREIKLRLPEELQHQPLTFKKNIGVFNITKPLTSFSNL
jgi:hypothetical protein